jgi:hypothetical protein
MARVYTAFKTDIIPSDEATAMFFHLSHNIEWVQGITTRSGDFTRFGKTINLDDHPEILRIIIQAVKLLQPEEKMVAIYGAYLNYYKDGDMWTPNHSHHGTAQLVISLGATRTLIVGKKEYKMTNGSAIIFGSSIHGVPKEPSIKEGRISIAVFLQK